MNKNSSKETLQQKIPSHLLLTTPPALIGIYSLSDTSLPESIAGILGYLTGLLFLFSGFIFSILTLITRESAEDLSIAFKYSRYAKISGRLFWIIFICAFIMLIIIQSII